MLGRYELTLDCERQRPLGQKLELVDRCYLEAKVAYPEIDSLAEISLHKRALD
jgi:hypothetical protein